MSVGVAVAVLKAHLTSNGWPPSCLEASPLFDISAAVCRARSAFLGNVCVCVSVCSAQYSALPGFGTASGCSCLLMKKLKHTPHTHTHTFMSKNKNRKQGRTERKKDEAPKTCKKAMV